MAFHQSHPATDSSAPLIYLISIGDSLIELSLRKQSFCFPSWYNTCSPPHSLLRVDPGRFFRVEAGSFLKNRSNVGGLGIHHAVYCPMK